MTTHPIRFYYRGAVREATDVPATRTVLQYLREDLHCTGTKEGCAEGDCGACTVVVGELDANRALSLKAVNACIQFLPTLDARALFTVEDLRGKDGRLHPLQSALVECHASQCGFCTPGFAMSMWAFYENRSRDAGPPSREEVATALSGNLCRCTGYRPLIDACRAMFDETRHPRVAFDRASVVEALRRIRRQATFEYTCTRPHDPAAPPSRFFAAATADDFAALRAAHPHARVLAGGTDVALWVTKQLREPGDLLYIGNVAEFRTIERRQTEFRIGAAASLEAAFSALIEDYPMLAELARRFASLPIRQAGTLGGNVANGSPIGDSMPALIALGAKVELRRGDTTRTLPLEAFYLGYQKTALDAGEFVAALRVPRAQPTLRFRTYKVSKRYDQDISAVCGAFSVEIVAHRITSARLAFGGMAATPRCAHAAQAALVGSAWNEATVQRAIEALAGDFAPLTDMRATSRYRTTVACNLLRRFYLETREAAPLAPTETSAFAFAEACEPDSGSVCAKETP